MKKISGFVNFLNKNSPIHLISLVLLPIAFMFFKIILFLSHVISEEIFFIFDFKYFIFIKPFESFPAPINCGESNDPTILKLPLINPEKDSKIFFVSGDILKILKLFKAISESIILLSL